MLSKKDETEKENINDGRKKKSKKEQAKKKETTAESREIPLVVNAAKESRVRSARNRQKATIGG